MWWRNGEAVLRAHIVKRRGEVTVDVSLELERGGALGLFGTSGAGKSTVLACIAGLEEPDEGYVQLGEAQFFPPALALYKRGVGLLSQDPWLFPLFRVVNSMSFRIAKEI